MIATDALSRIVAWNRAASDLLGYAPAEVVGRCCAEVLQWRDRDQNLVCSPECSIRVRAARGLIAESQNVLATGKSGRRIWLSVSTLVLPREHHRVCRLVHFVREIALVPAEQHAVLAGQPGGEGKRRQELLGKLTRREEEVLDLLTLAMSTDQIANRLGISRVTIRNHVQRMLAKLEVHNRVEAIALALREHRLGSASAGR